jgi:uncharacterized protein (TIGR03437 family)
VDAIANSASYWRGGLNQAGIAQGSLFVVLGSNLGPADLAQAQFPLKDHLAGSSVQVQIGSTVVSALMVYTVSRQIGAVLPSGTPVGAGTLTVTYNGRSSATVPIIVAATAIGVYTLNQGGTGPAAVTTSSYQVIGPSFAANPGETLIAWATGAGAVVGDESVGPITGPLGGVDVFVGTKPAVVRYAGRSGCCAGVDQVAFDVPAGVSGCFVPLVIRSHGVAGNFSSIAIAAEGRQCSDPIGLPQSALAKAAAGEDLRFGAIGLGAESLLTTLAYRIDRRIPVWEFTPNVLMASLDRILSASSFARTNRVKARKAAREALRSYREARRKGERPKLDRAQVEAALTASGPVALIAEFGVVHDVGPALSYVTANVSAIGSCSLGVCVTADCGFPAVLPRTHGAILDAGKTLSVSGPAGSGSAAKLRGGDYRVVLPLATTSTGLPTGTYTVTGLGGADIGAFSATLNLPATLHWTNQAQISAINRQADLTMTWNPERNSGYVLIGGTSSYTAAGKTAMFLCSEDSSKSTFTVPSFVLSAMPVPPTGGRGYLFLASYPFDNPFTAKNLDLAFFREISLEAKQVLFQ